MKNLIFLFAMIMLLLSGCSFFRTVGPTPAPITIPWVCQNSGNPDISQNLVLLKKEYIDRRNFQVGARILKDILSKMSCSVPAVYRVMFSYTVNNPLPGQPLKEVYCLSVSILEDEENNPYFEEWAACIPASTDMSYLIDFNNVTTDNKSINQKLRIRNVFPVGGQLKQLISQRLPGSFVIHDNDEFFYESIGFDLGVPETVVENFYVISAF